jgi:hypothetical protein
MGASQKGFINKCKKTGLKNAPSLKYKWKCDDYFFGNSAIFFKNKREYVRKYLFHFHFSHL